MVKRGGVKKKVNKIHLTYKVLYLKMFGLDKPVLKPQLTIH